MDGVISQVIFYCQKKEYDQVCSIIDRSQEAILRGAMQWSHVITMFLEEPARYTIPLAYFAYLRSTTREETVDGTLTAAEKLIAYGDFLQCRGRILPLAALRGLLSRYAEICRDLKQYNRAIYHLKLAIQAYHVDSTELTPVHSDILTLCIKGKNIAVAQELVANTILRIDPGNTGIRITDYLTYYYYAGLALALAKQWEAAIKHLEACLIAPGQAASAVMVEAYKVYILCGVIARGRFLSLPAAACAMMDRIAHSLCSEYVDFALQCQSKNIKKMDKSLHECAHAFGRDNLLALAAQARFAVVKQSILSLTQIYLTLSLKDIAKEVDMDETMVHSLLREMKAEGMLHASIAKDGLVSFHNKPPITTHDVEERLTNLRTLVARVHQLDEEVMLSTDFAVEKLQSMPNFGELMADYEAKRRAARGVSGMVSDMFHGGLGGPAGGAY